MYLSKAFDRINHYRLYNKLIERSLPLNIVMILFNLYKSSSSVVSWNGFLSKPYKIYAGVRQGGSMSPEIFSVYVNSVIEILLNSDLGCHIGQVYLGVIMYADDPASYLRFSHECKLIRAKFYRSFNALYSKISRANECVLISLVKQFCIPIVTYSLEAIRLNSSTLSGLDNVLYNAFGKIFKTYHHNSLSCCMYYLNCLPIKYLYYEKTAKFLMKSENHVNPIVKLCFNIYGEWELYEIEEKFHLERTKTHPTMLSERIWETFENSIEINWLIMYDMNWSARYDYMHLLCACVYICMYIYVRICYICVYCVHICVCI